MIIVPVNQAFKKRASSTSEKRPGSDARVDPSKVTHGYTVWLLIEGSSERQKGHFDEPTNGCVLEKDFQSLKADRASANRKRKPYDWRTMRSPLRNSSATSFVRTPGLDPVERTPALAVVASPADAAASEPADSGSGIDDSSRPAKSMMRSPRTEAVRRRSTGAQSEDGIPANAVPA